MPSPISPIESASTAASFLRRNFGEAASAPIAIVLGSGLGAFASQLRQTASIEYREIPYFPAPSVPGHQGLLLAGTLGDTPVLVLQGRVHGYEGYTAEQVAFPVRALGLLGVKALVLTNAAGGLRADMQPGDFVLLSDHINFTGQNPAAGTLLTDADPPAKWNRADDANRARKPGFGPRFFDMSSAYSPQLRALAHSAAADAGATLAEGVYLGVSGPSFETPAEIRAFRSWGADLVGMSTVLETIAARQMGIEVLGISCVTNMAAGMEATPLSHDEVMETGRSVESALASLLGGLVPRIAAHLGQSQPVA